MRNTVTSSRISLGIATRSAKRDDAQCERCGVKVRWNHKRSARDPGTGALQVVCRYCEQIARAQRRET